MARIASGSNLVLKRIDETDFGVIPDAGSRTINQQRFTTYTPTFTKNEVTDPTVTGNRQAIHQRFTTAEMTLSLEAVLSHEDQDDLIASGLWSAWTPTDENGERTITVGTPAEPRSFTYEAHQTDIDTRRQFTGITVNSMTIASPLDGNSTITYETLGQEELKLSESLGDPVPFSGNAPYTHIDGTIDLSYVEGLDDNCVVQSFELTVANNATADFCWGERGAHAVTEAQVDVTGSVTLFYTGPELNDAWLDDEEGSLSVILRDEDGNEFEIDLPRIAPTGADNPFAEGNRVITMPFRALAAVDGSFNAVTIRARGYTDLPEPVEV